jgi:hypothetical protein
MFPAKKTRLICLRRDPTNLFSTNYGAVTTRKNCWTFCRVGVR